MIALSDPWALGEAVAWRELSATLVLGHALTDVDATIVLTEALSCGNAEYRTFAVSPRHLGQSMKDVFAGAEVFAFFESRDQRADSAGPMPPLRFIGTVIPG